jgi:hypothetical protein
VTKSGAETATGRQQTNFFIYDQLNKYFFTPADATQVFGGRALTVTGMGKVIENYHRTVMFDTSEFPSTVNRAYD